MATSVSDREAARVTEPRRAPRRVLVWIVIGLVALVAAVTVYWALARSGAAPAPPAVTVGEAPTSTTAAPSSSAEPTTPTGGVGRSGADGERVPGRAGPVPGRARGAAGRHPGPGRRRRVRVDVRPLDRHLPDRPQRPGGAGPGRRPRLPTRAPARASTSTPPPSARPATPPPAPPPAPPDQYRIQSTNQDQTSVTLDLIVYRQSTTATGAGRDRSGASPRCCWTWWTGTGRYTARCPRSAAIRSRRMRVLPGSRTWGPADAAADRTLADCR